MNDSQQTISTDPPIVTDPQISEEWVETEAKRAGDPINLRSNVRANTSPATDSAHFGHAYHRLLLATDMAGLLVSVVATLLLTEAIGREVHVSQWAFFMLGMIPVWILVAYVLGLYSQVERRISFDYVAELNPIVVAATFWCWIFVLVRSLVLDGITELFALGVMWVLMVPTLLVFRAAARAFARKRPWYRRSVALVGDIETVEVLHARIDRHPEWGLEVGLEIVQRPDDGGWQVRRLVDGNLEDHGSVEPDVGNGAMTIGLTELVVDAGIDRALVSGGMEQLGTRTNLAYTMVNRGIAVDHVSGGPESLYASSMLQQLEGMSLMSSRPSYPRPMGAILKRSVDIALSVFLLILTSPVLLFSAIAIRLGSKGPVIFRQDRVGFKGDTFQVYKLRSMVVGADSQRSALRHRSIHGGDDGMLKLKNDPRVTGVGKFLRRSSIDELPQLWNVLVGDMSLVGPRPLPLDEIAGIDAKYRVRQRVRPGITGPWQVMGRSEIPMEDMLKLDCAYVTSWSLGEDFRILLRTLSAVSGRSGVF
ncbi:MAG: sugar transferase [Solirubrobacterales bacterium]